MAFTAVYFFQDSTLQARIEFEADRQNLNFAKYVAELVAKYVEQKWKANINAKNSRQFYFVCQEYAGKASVPVARFIENACKEMMEGEKPPWYVLPKASKAQDE